MAILSLSWLFGWCFWVVCITTSHQTCRGRQWGIQRNKPQGKQVESGFQGTQETCEKSPFEGIIKGVSSIHWHCPFWKPCFLVEGEFGLDFHWGKLKHCINCFKRGQKNRTRWLKNGASHWSWNILLYHVKGCTISSLHTRNFAHCRWHLYHPKKESSLPINVQVRADTSFGAVFFLILWLTLHIQVFLAQWKMTCPLNCTCANPTSSSKLDLALSPLKPEKKTLKICQKTQMQS